MSPRRAARPAVAGALAALVLAGCSAGTEPVSAPGSAPGTSAAPTTAASTTAAGTVVEVRYAGGEVIGVDPRVPVRLGEQVVLRVTSDVVEQIHVHGYDVYVDLQPGVPAEATFAADKPGSWEVELHDAGRPLFSLRVA